MSGASGEGVAQAVATSPHASNAHAAPAPDTVERELGRAGGLLVAMVVIAGLLVAAISVFGLLWFIPYAGVGAVLAVRRPGNTIGWILLTMAWAHALTVLPINATVDQFHAGPPLDVAIVAVISNTAAVALFPLYALLAFVFPSGTLPAGRWGTVARLAFVATLVVGVVTVLAPTINVNPPEHPNGVAVRNPLALAPDLSIWPYLTPGPGFAVTLALLVTAAISLLVRVRRATGIERQQLRWIAASITFVVGSVLVVVTIGALVPAVAGDIALLAIVAFVTVPVSVGVAVMRYRLYEIDTIINRAIVYGLLTAILAGGSSAAVGLTQTLFVGVLGPGSTVTIVVTTLLVVSAFNPIKTRLEAVVDRRFKPAPDPVTALKAFVSELRGGMARPDRDRAFRRLIELAVPEFATAAEARWTDGDGREQRAAAGPDPAPYTTPIRVEVGAAAVELRLAGVTTPRTEPPLREAMTAVLEETRPATA